MELHWPALGTMRVECLHFAFWLDSTSSSSTYSLQCPKLVSRDIFWSVKCIYRAAGAPPPPLSRVCILANGQNVYINSLDSILLLLGFSEVCFCVFSECVYYIENVLLALGSQLQLHGARTKGTFGYNHDDEHKHTASIWVLSTESLWFALSSSPYIHGDACHEQH